jgi:aspartate aminotransferase
VRAACLRLGLAGSTEFAERLLEDAKVAVVPGIAFGLDNHVRLSFASDLPTIDKGLDRIEKFLLSEPRR